MSNIDKEKKLVEINPRSPVTCSCGKSVQQRNLASHCSSKTHARLENKKAESAKDENDGIEKNDSSDLVIDLVAFLRERDLRNDQSRVQEIVQRHQNMDPYTKLELETNKGKLILDNFDVDHIHEAQILAAAIRRTPDLAPRINNISVLKPMRSVLNDVPNLAITDAKINRSKGQAVKYFLGHLQTSTEIPLLSAFIQTSVGKERSIAQFAQNIVKTIEATSSDMSDSIREARMENGHITGSNAYEKVSEHFDTIIDRMQLNWNEGVKLRNGKTYYVSK